MNLLDSSALRFDPLFVSPLALAGFVTTALLCVQWIAQLFADVTEDSK